MGMGGNSDRKPPIYIAVQYVLVWNTGLSRWQFTTFVQDIYQYRRSCKASRDNTHTYHVMAARTEVAASAMMIKIQGILWYQGWEGGVGTTHSMIGRPL